MASQSSKPASFPLNKLDDIIELKLIENRRLFLCDSVDNDSMKDAIRKLWYMQMLDPKAPIVIVINSPGGSVDAGMALLDQIHGLTCPVYTVVAGMAASMGTILSVAANKGRRFAMRNSRMMIHQPSIHSVVRGQASDLAITAEQIIKTKKRLIAIYSEATGQKPEVIDKALDRDTWMDAEEALKFGLIDAIIDSLDSIKL